MMLPSSVSSFVVKGQLTARTQIGLEVTELLVKLEYSLKVIFLINMLNSETVFCPHQ